jgi:putative lipoic acid-binding regulatory protein
VSDGPAPDSGEKKPLIEYPTVYAFKVMGRLEHGFSEWVRLLFSRMMGSEVSRDSLSESVSNKGNYVSVTVSVYLLSEDHRRSIYETLHKEKRILYYL